MNRAYSLLEIKSVDDDEYVIEGIASTPTPDRYGDVVEPMGAKFSIPMPLLWQHRSNQPVGEVEFAQPTKDGIPFRARIRKPSEFTSQTLQERALEAWESVKTKLVRAVSIGFSALDYSFMDGGGIHFREWEWLELSLVTIPANAEATITAIKSIDSELRAASGRKGLAARPVPPGASGAKPKAQPKPKGATMTIKEQIAALEARRAAHQGRMQEITDAVIGEGRTKDESEQQEFDELRDDIKAIDRELKDLRDMDEMNVAAAKPVSGAKSAEAGEARAPARVVVTEKKLGKGIRFARLARCTALSKLDVQPIRDVAAKLYPDDGVIQKAAVEGGTSASGSWAANLVGDESSIFADFVEYLRPMTIVGKFGQDSPGGVIPSLRSVPFRTPLISQTAGGSGYWVGEGLGKPLTALDFSRTTLDELKVANIAVVTEELLRKSSPSADAILRDSLAAALAERIDTDFINPGKAASAGVSPASITNGASAIESAATGGSGTADDVRTDIAALMAPFIAANNPPMQAVLIMSATTALQLSLMRNALGQSEFSDISMLGGRLEGIPVIVSEYVPTNYDFSFVSTNTGPVVVLANASDIYFADEGGVMVDMSREASLQMDDSPTQDAGTPTASTTVSLWQTNAVGFRAERILNWSLRRSSAVQVLGAANYAA